MKNNRWIVVVCAALLSLPCIAQQQKNVQASVEVENLNGEIQREVTIDIEQAGAEKKTIKWKDNGEIPADIKQQLEAEGIDLAIIEGSSQGDDEDIKRVKEKSIEIIVESDEDDRTITSEEIYKRMKEEGINIDDMDGKRRIMIKRRGDGHMLEGRDKVVRIKIEMDENGTEKGDKRQIKIVTKGNGADKEVIEWEDNGELPDEVKKMLDEKGIEWNEMEDGKQIFIHKGGEGHKMIIKKSGDDDEEIIEWNGEGEMPEGLEEHIFEFDIEEGDGQNIYFLKDGDAEKHIKVVIKDEDGEDKIIEWDGEGEIPVELEEYAFDFDLEEGEDKYVFIHDDGAERHVKIKFIGEDGEERIMEWEGDGEMPAEMMEMMEEHDINIDMHEGKPHKRRIHINRGHATNKIRLGVGLEKQDDGLRILEVFENTPAKEFGLEKGDVIRSIDDSKIKEVEDILNILKDKKPGETVMIGHERKGKKLQTAVVLGKEIVPSENDHRKWAVKKEHKVHKDHKRMNKEEMRDPPVIAKDKRLSLKEFKAFPNPTSNNIEVSFVGKKDPIMIQITDISGREVYREFIQNFNGQYAKNIDLSDNSPGTYILYVIQNQKIHTESILLQ